MTGSLSSERTRGADSKTTRSLSSEGTQLVQEHQMIGSLSSGKAQGAQTESPSRGEKRRAQEQGSERTGGLSGAAMKGALENTSGKTKSRSSGKAPTTQEHMSGRDRSLSSRETKSPKHASRRTKSHREESAPEDRKPMVGETEPSLGTPEDNQMKLTEGKKSRQAMEVALQTTQGVQPEEQHRLAATFPKGEDDPRRVSGRDLQRARGGSEDLRKTTVIHVSTTVRRVIHVSTTVRRMIHVSTTVRRVIYVSTTVRRVIHVSTTVRRVIHVSTTVRRVTHVSTTTCRVVVMAHQMVQGMATARRVMK